MSLRPVKAIIAGIGRRGSVILPRLLSIALRRYTAEPDGREASARMLLLNSMRLAIHHVGRRRAAELVLQVLSEDHQEAA